MSGLHDRSWQSLGLAVLCAACAMTIGGCNKGPSLVTVEGTVTINGKPLENGAISFEAADQQGPTVGATINGGKYETQATPGEKKVRITGFEVVGRQPMYPDKPDSAMRDIVKEVVPEKYNFNSELTLIVESSTTTGNFDLK